jgi:hypothetical protein
MTDPGRAIGFAMLAASLTVTAAVPSTEQPAGATTPAEPPAAASNTEPAHANSAANDAAQAAGPSAEEILSGTAPPVDYSQAVKCIQSERLERTEPLSERYIVFHLKGDALWIAQMRNRCPGMTSQSKLMFEKINPRICEWDTVRVVYDEGTHLRFGPRCNLPKFEPVSPEQVGMIKERLATTNKNLQNSPQ